MIPYTDQPQAILDAMAAPLLAWYDENKRTLPWRETRDPYRVWVSEIMLQQTRVAAVIPYYRRWMTELPDVQALAAVEEEKLLKLWEGLGYYSRARNLKKAAGVIMEAYDGQFPRTYGELLQLPGIGEYTAGAVASIAFGEKVAAVDGNVLRLAARAALLEGDIMDARVRREMKARMDQATPSDRPGDFNQALMDLGATVCLPNGAPDCAACPLASRCAAHALGRERELPVKSKKAPRRLEEMTVFLLLCQGRAALRKRPDAGLLAGLWEFPHVLGTLDEARAGEVLAAWGLRPLDWREKVEARHIFTHVEWHMTGYLLDVMAPAGDFTWAGPEELEALAVPSAFSKYLAAVRRALQGAAGGGQADGTMRGPSAQTTTRPGAAPKLGEQL